MSTIHEVKARHEKRVLALPGVVSMGIGRAEDGAPTIVVGLDRPRPDTVRRIPQVLEGHPVRVEIVGPLKGR